MSSYIPNPAEPSHKCTFLVTWNQKKHLHMDQHSGFISWWWGGKRVKTNIFCHSSLHFLFYVLSNSPSFLVTVGLKADPPSLSWQSWTRTSRSSIHRKQVRKPSRDSIIQAYLRDIMGLAPDLHNKANITTKWVTWIFWFPSAYKSYVYTILWSTKCVIRALRLKKCTYCNFKILYW